MISIWLLGYEFFIFSGNYLRSIYTLIGYYDYFYIFTDRRVGFYQNTKLFPYTFMAIKKDNGSNENKISSKELILKTAYGLFLKKGYHSVSIKDIMEASKLSKGGIYHHFESKEGILFAVLDQYFFKELSVDEFAFENLTFKERIESVYMRAVSLFAKVESMGKNGIKYPIQRLFHFQLECEIFPEIRKQFSETSNAYLKHVQDIVYEGILTNEVKKELDAEILSIQIVGMIEGIAIHNSSVKKNIDYMLIEKYDKVFNSYFNFICPNT